MNAISKPSSYQSIENTVDCSSVYKNDKDKRPLKVAYLSRRFEDYPGTQMMLRLFSEHNRSNVAIWAYAHGPDDESYYRKIIQRDSDSFIDISSLSSSASTKTISSENIDILIDYDGIHDFNNLKVLANRPASIQMTWLGFAGTTGSSYVFDYLVADAYIVSPDSMSSQFSEKLIYLDSYQPQDEFQGALQKTDISNLDDDSIFYVASNYMLPRENKIEKRKKILLSSQLPNDSNIELLAASYWLISFNRITKVTPGIICEYICTNTFEFI